LRPASQTENIARGNGKNLGQRKKFFILQKQNFEKELEKASEQ